MADNTAELPDVRAQLERVAEMTSVLPQMDRRMATIEEAMPVLVEVSTSRSSRSAGSRTASRAATAARARGNLTGFRSEPPLRQRRTLRYYSGEI